MTIKVTVTDNWGECGHSDSGCSGWESLTIEATNNKGQTVKAEYSSCFGIDREAVIKELLEKWDGLK